MATDFSQVPVSEWKATDSQAIAAIDLTPGAIARRLGKVEFQKIEDDLGPIQVAVLRPRSQPAFVLLRYINNPAKGTELWTNDPPMKWARDLENALTLLGVTSQELTWTHPQIDLERKRVAKTNARSTAHAKHQGERPKIPRSKSRAMTFYSYVDGKVAEVGSKHARGPSQHKAVSRSRAAKKK
jgi:hypothetical protein